MSFVEVENVSKSFGDNVVLRNVTIEVAEHEVVCLIGASGSGKSTLLRCINLLEPIDEGRIVVDGDLITIPLARFTDHLVAQREARERAQAF